MEETKNFFTRKSSGGHEAKKEKRKKPKPEEQEGMMPHNKYNTCSLL
jgi:hypothetical protein